MSRLQRCKDLLADLAKQIAAVEQNINSNFPSTSSYVRPAVTSTAGPSSVPLATVFEHQQIFDCTPHSAQNQRQAKKWPDQKSATSKKRKT